MVVFGDSLGSVKRPAFVWKAKDFFLIVEVYFCWLGRVYRVVLLSIFCFVSLRESFDHA